MKIGIIAPVKLLKYCTTEIQYVLPRLYSDSNEYRRFYDSKKEEGNTIILDCNRLGWRREPEDLSLCVDVAHFLSPSYIILPSCMYSYAKTIEVSHRYRKEFRDTELVGCLEGTNSEEVEKCLASFKKGPLTVAIPSHIYSFWKGEDWIGPKVYIENHLNLEELLGLDGILVTSLPVRLGLQGRLLSDYKPVPPSLTYEEEDKYPLITAKNIEETIKYYEL